MCTEHNVLCTMDNRMHPIDRYKEASYDLLKINPIYPHNHEHVCVPCASISVQFIPEPANGNHNN